MGTTKSRADKVEFIANWLLKIAEKEKGMPRKELEGKLMIIKYTSKQVAKEIIDSFINAGRCTMIVENGEEILYG
jgi:hypothetical protein